ncbi:hypothetical protein [Erwinia sorbitola]|uniref:Lipoprotein n=1 Tax=Erwinia sorbitola TaxID=2681984 RepID=A0A6I6EG95_9GAMM|nr:hypothetical protein [Erwinia sorbitola]QGU87598.1 hypothetical protein GN242_10380 [Erwinia sorbitola]
MFYRLTLTTIATAMMLTGCAQHPQDIPADQYASGPTQINVSHIVTQTDDGSAVVVTVDGRDAGVLDGGEHALLHVPSGEHKVGGYVPTLLGRVTIPAVDVTTSQNKVTTVAYTVARDKAAFTQVARLPG